LVSKGASDRPRCSAAKSGDLYPDESNPQPGGQALHRMRPSGRKAVERQIDPAYTDFRSWAKSAELSDATGRQLSGEHGRIANAVARERFSIFIRDGFRQNIRSRHVGQGRGSRRRKDALVLDRPLPDRFAAWMAPPTGIFAPLVIFERRPNTAL